MTNVGKSRNLQSMGKAETKSTPASIKLSYTPPDDPDQDQDPQEMVRDSGIPIRVGRDPGHTGFQLSVKDGDRSVSGWAVEITLVGEGVILKANNNQPMSYLTVSGQAGSLGGPHPFTGFSEDGWIEIPGEDGQVVHRVSWELCDFSPPTREKTNSSTDETLGHSIFMRLSTFTDNDGNLTYLMTCAAVVSPWFFTFDQISGKRVPSNPQIGLMKGDTSGKHDVQRLKEKINLLYANARTEPPFFDGQPGRSELAEWILENHLARDGTGGLTAQRIRELLPGLELLNPR